MRFRRPFSSSVVDAVAVVLGDGASSTHWACVTVENYCSTSIVGDFDLAGAAVGDAAVGEFDEVILFDLGAFFGRCGLTLQVAGCEGLHGVCSDLYLKSIALRIFWGVRAVTLQD